MLWRSQMSELHMRILNDTERETEKLKHAIEQVCI